MIRPSSVKLGEVAREVSERPDPGARRPVYSVTKHAGFVPSLEYFSKQVFSRDTSGYKVVRRGNFAYATIHLDEGSLGLLSTEDAVLISPMYTVFEVDQSRVDPGFLFRVLKSPQMLARYANLGKGSVHRRKAISFDRLATVEFALPPLPEQRRAALAFDKVDDIRVKRMRALELCALLLRSAFVEAFGDPIANARRWPVVPLSALGRITTGNTPPRHVAEYFGSDIEWIKSDNINTPGHFLSRASEGLSAAGRAMGRVVPAGSILMTCIAGTPECIGNVAIADREVAFNQQINAVTPHPGVDYRFLYVLLLVAKKAVQAASTNSMKGMVSKGKLEEVHLPCPPAELQASFGRTFDAVLRLSKRQESALKEGERLHASVAGWLLGAAPAAARVRDTRLG